MGARSEDARPNFTAWDSRGILAWASDRFETAGASCSLGSQECLCNAFLRLRSKHTRLYASQLFSQVPGVSPNTQNRAHTHRELEAREQQHMKPDLDTVFGEHLSKRAMPKKLYVHSHSLMFLPGPQSIIGLLRIGNRPLLQPALYSLISAASPIGNHSNHR